MLSPLTSESRYGHSERSPFILQWANESVQKVSCRPVKNIGSPCPVRAAARTVKSRPNEQISTTITVYIV